MQGNQPQMDTDEHKSGNRKESGGEVFHPDSGVTAMEQLTEFFL